MVVTDWGNEMLLRLRLVPLVSNALAPIVVSGASKWMMFMPNSEYSISVIVALNADSSMPFRLLPSIVVNHISLSSGVPSDGIAESGIAIGPGSLQPIKMSASSAHIALNILIDYSIAVPKSVADEQSVILTSM